MTNQTQEKEVLAQAIITPSQLEQMANLELNNFKRVCIFSHTIILKNLKASKNNQVIGITLPLSEIGLEYNSKDYHEFLSAMEVEYNVRVDKNGYGHYFEIIKK